MGQPHEGWEDGTSMIVGEIKERDPICTTLNWLNSQIQHQILFTPQNKDEACGIRF